MENSGKKVIFLYPPSVINDVVVELSRNEYEVYFTDDHAKLALYLAQRSDCLVFVNIDTALKEAEWDAWLRQRAAAKNGTGYGIVTYNENKVLAQKYLIEIGLTCGFIVLKIGAAKATSILLKTLEANEARGKRKYIRSHPASMAAEFNVDIFGRVVRGSIHDISIVGMSVKFEVDPRLTNGQKVADFQLNLKGVLVKVSSVMYGCREEPENGKLHIFIFDPSTMNEEKRGKIRAFVRRSLQDAFDKELQRL